MTGISASKGFIVGLLLLAAGVSVLFAQSAGAGKEAALKEGVRAVHLMDDWMRDPYIVLAPDGHYYLSATRPINAFPGGMPSIQLYRSSNLHDWEDLGVLWKAIDTDWGLRLIEEGKNQNKAANIWAPEMHFINGRWVIVNLSAVGMTNLMITEGEALKAPFYEPFDVGKKPDPSIFTDDDGSNWLVFGFNAVYIQKIKPCFSGFDGERIEIGPSNRKLGHEGCQIIKIGGKYVLLGTAWSTDVMRRGTYNLYYCTADNLAGPYGPRKFAGRYLGHGTMFKDKDGKWRCTAFYNADRPALTPEEAKLKKLDDAAYTINKQGLTIVPMDVQVIDGDVLIRAVDPDYAYPGAEEVQKF